MGGVVQTDPRNGYILAYSDSGAFFQSVSIAFLVGGIKRGRTERCEERPLRACCRCQFPSGARGEVANASGLAEPKADEVQSIERADEYPKPRRRSEGTLREDVPQTACRKLCSVAQGELNEVMAARPAILMLN